MQHGLVWVAGSPELAHLCFLQRRGGCQVGGKRGRGRGRQACTTAEGFQEPSRPLLGGQTAWYLAHTPLCRSSGAKGQTCATQASVTPARLRQMGADGYGHVTPKEQMADRCGHWRTSRHLPQLTQVGGDEQI